MTLSAVFRNLSRTVAAMSRRSQPHDKLRTLLLGYLLRILRSTEDLFHFSRHRVRLFDATLIELCTLHFRRIAAIERSATSQPRISVLPPFNICAMSTRRKTALVTGCSSGGIGSAMCEELKRRGFHVFATLRTPSKASTLETGNKNDSGGFIEVLELDVTSRDSIRGCAAEVRSRGVEQLDVLVNNAGQMFVSPLLDADVDATRRLFEVNVFSTLTVTQAFAPLLIAAKGTILNVSSVAAVWSTHSSNNKIRNQ